jgi:biotin transport system substrate-specific component
MEGREKEEVIFTLTPCLPAGRQPSPACGPKPSAGRPVNGEGKYFLERNIMSIEKLRWMVLASLMAALTAVGAYIHVPIGPVPIVLSTLFVVLSGLLLGSRWGLASMGLYLLVGAIGIPVFAGGKGGFAHFFGPTGGYLFGYVLAAWVTGLISERSHGSLILDIFAVVIGSFVIYGLGVPWLKMVTQMSWPKTLMVGVVPFLIGDAVKAAVAVVLARSVRPILKRQLTNE